MEDPCLLMQREGMLHPKFRVLMPKIIFRIFKIFDVAISLLVVAERTISPTAAVIRRSSVRWTFFFSLSHSHSLELPKNMQPNPRSHAASNPIPDSRSRRSKSSQRCFVFYRSSPAMPCLASREVFPSPSLGPFSHWLQPIIDYSDYA